MTVLIYLIPISFGLGLLGLGAFLWSLQSGQYEDMDGAAERILFDDDGPVTPAASDRADAQQPDSGAAATPPARDEETA